MEKRTVDMKDIIIQKLTQQIGQYVGLVAELEVKILYLQQEFERTVKELEEAKTKEVEITEE